jgi:hypothetical protein
LRGGVGGGLQRDFGPERAAIVQGKSDGQADADQGHREHDRDRAPLVLPQACQFSPKMFESHRLVSICRRARRMWRWFSIENYGNFVEIYRNRSFEFYRNIACVRLCAGFDKGFVRDHIAGDDSIAFA